MSAADSPESQGPKLPSNVRIAGTGSYLPEKILTNAELEILVETSDDWITSRTGIKERRIAAEGEFTSHLAAKAAEKALEQAGIDAADVELIIVATITPDTLTPATACYVQQHLGALKSVAFDVSAACSGFLYALELARHSVGAGAFKNAVIIGAEKLSAFVNWKDRNTCVLFGDGAGAAVLVPSETAMAEFYHLISELTVPRLNCSTFPAEEPLVRSRSKTLIKISRFCQCKAVKFSSTR